MTREEQIISEAKKYYSDSINCHNAFLHGVEWADEHPVNVWHDASEEPAGDSWVILCEDDSGNCFCQNKIIVVELFLNWQESAEKVWLKRWAYVSDLLPKEGEE